VQDLYTGAWGMPAAGHSRVPVQFSKLTTGLSAAKRAINASAKSWLNLGWLAQRTPDRRQVGHPLARGTRNRAVGLYRALGSAGAIL
jgi:hypothetical protein